MNENDFDTIPALLQHASMESERPWSLKQMRELLVIAYQLTNHPILGNWKTHDPVDLFDMRDFDAEKFKRFNRTLIERTITQSAYYSQVETGHGVLTMSSKGIEYAIFSLESFYLTANKFYASGKEEIQHLSSGIHYYRLTAPGELTASISYLMEVCNDMISLTLKHFISAQIKLLATDEEKVKYLLRQKADLTIIKDQFTDKVFQEVVGLIDVELGYHKEVNEYLDTPAELKAIVSQFFAEKKARISNSKLLTHLLEENLDAFCNDLSVLVMQLFSYHDIGAQEPEKVYHVFLLGVLNSFKEFYRLESNKEAGLGRFDIMLIPETLEYKAVIIEVKRSLIDDKEKTSKMLDEALQQIASNHYALTLKAAGHNEYIALAAVFFGKELALKYKRSGTD